MLGKDDDDDDTLLQERMKSSVRMFFIFFKKNFKVNFLCLLLKGENISFVETGESPFSLKERFVVVLGGKHFFCLV